MNAFRGSSAPKHSKRYRQSQQYDSTVCQNELYRTPNDTHVTATPTSGSGQCSLGDRQGTSPGYVSSQKVAVKKVGAGGAEAKCGITEGGWPDLLQKLKSGDWATYKRNVGNERFVVVLNWLFQLQFAIEKYICCPWWNQTIDLLTIFC